MCVYRLASLNSVAFKLLLHFSSAFSITVMSFES